MLYSWDWVLDFVKACAKMAVIWVISTILAIVLDSCGIRAENLLLVYLLGVLISILATSSLAWALCAAIVFTFTFNYLFTEPKLTFHMDDVNYVVSSIVFVAGGAVVCAPPGGLFLGGACLYCGHPGGEAAEADADCQQKERDYGQDE